MLTPYHYPEIPAPLRKIATAFRWWGWIGFWMQLVLAFLAAIALLFAVSGSVVNPNASSEIGVATFWAVCGIVLLIASLLLDAQYIRIAKGLMHEPGAILHPRKTGAIRLLRLGILLGFIGIVLSLLGSGASIVVLIAKTVSQPPGIAITDPNKIVRAMDVFVVLANTTLIAAHLAGTAIAFWLLDRVHHYYYSHPSIIQATLE
jgi:Protein of unknown function (DUF3611)